MKSTIKIKNKTNNQIVEAKVMELNLADLDDILKFQSIILDFLENKELYSPTSKEEFLEYFTKNSYILGIKTLNDNKLISIGVYINNGLNHHNYGYDLNYTEDMLLKTGQIESTLVIPEFRGNKLQKLICEILEEHSRNNGDLYLTATASPLNPYSLNTFIKLGYENKLEKLKYGGLKRAILEKKLF